MSGCSPKIIAVVKIAYSNDASCIDTTCSILRLTSNVMCLRSRGRAEFRRRRKSLPPPPAKFWSARQPDLVRASRKSGGGAAEGSKRQYWHRWSRTVHPIVKISEVKDLALILSISVFSLSSLHLLSKSTLSNRFATLFLLTHNRLMRCSFSVNPVAVAALLFLHHCWQRIFNENTNYFQMCIFSILSSMLCEIFI